MTRPTRSRHAAIVLAVMTMPMSACAMPGSDETAQGSGGERRYAIEGFDRVSLAGAGDVEVRVGPGFSVVATGTPTALDKLVVERDGRALKIGRRRGTSWTQDDRVHFRVSMPAITAADIGGSGSITVDRVPGGSFEGNIGGSGRLDLRGMAVEKASFSIGGSGDVAAAGTARELNVAIGGSGRVRAQPLRAETGKITVAGAGDVQATVARTAEVTIMGSGDVTIGGGAKCSVTKMGGGRVNCG